MPSLPAIPRVLGLRSEYPPRSPLDAAAQALECARARYQSLRMRNAYRASSAEVARSHAEMQASLDDLMRAQRRYLDVRHEAEIHGRREEKRGDAI